MVVIVPAAGLSSRFPNVRPKYCLTDHNGKLMIERALEQFLGKNRVVVGVLKEHEEEYKVVSLLKHQMSEIEVVVLENQTSGPADTVFQTINNSNIDASEELLIKDCDSFFEHEYIQGNYICISKFADNNLIRTPSCKSFVISNDQGIITNISEKRVISDKFCVGGYKFENVALFTSTYEHLGQYDEEIYVSNVIQHCLFHEHIFVENVVKNYVDVGTAKEWFHYNDKSVIFCDIDGTLIKAQAKNDYDKEPVIFWNSVNRIKDLEKEGSQVVFVTSRPEVARWDTFDMLKTLGFKDPKLIMGLKNCKRVVVNDFNAANPYPRAIAVNVERDSDTLAKYL